MSSNARPSNAAVENKNGVKNPPSTMSKNNDETTKTADLKPEEEEDEEVRIAIQMAMMAASHPNLSPDELRKLVTNINKNNKQAEIVEEAKKKKEPPAAVTSSSTGANAGGSGGGWWFSKTAESVLDAAIELRDAAEQRAQEMKDRAERTLYADKIKSDPEYIELRKKIRIMQKTLKAHRLQGNRVETRHTFKRQRQERNLLQLYEKLEKAQKLFTETNFNIHEYAKAMMRASRKWKKKGSDSELNYEAQLCRNMHQMLALEKQKSKVKKSTREIKKYMQRCKSWLSDKKALCEMHIMTLDATHHSMKILYEDTIKQQDALIAKLLKCGEFDGVDLDAIELENWKQLSDTPLLGPKYMLCALRGLPINDSIRLKKEHDNNGDLANAAAGATTSSATGRKEVVIETKDDGSVDSNLSDPDDKGVDLVKDDSSLSDSDNRFDFGSDAPWMASASNLNDDEEKAAPPVGKKLETPPSIDEMSPAVEGKKRKEPKGSNGVERKPEPPVSEKAATKSPPAGKKPVSNLSLNEEKKIADGSKKMKDPASEGAGVIKEDAVVATPQPQTAGKKTKRSNKAYAPDESEHSTSVGEYKLYSMEITLRKTHRHALFFPWL